MSCTIYLETERNYTAPDTWDFIWGVTGAEWNTTEAVQPFVSKDRMYAAIVNLGRACRCLADNEVYGGSIEMKSDTDGKDHRYESEHNALYSLINPGDDIEGRKFRSLYFEYSRYIGRIKVLQNQWNTEIKLRD